MRTLPEAWTVAVRGCPSFDDWFDPAGRSQYHYDRTHLHPAVEIDHIFIGQPDAAPWLQTGNPWAQFKVALVHFATIPMSYEQRLWTDALPWSYIPDQLLARLPGAFLFLLAVAFISAMVGAADLVQLVRGLAPASWPSRGGAARQRRADRLRLEQRIGIRTSRCGSRSAGGASRARVRARRTRPR